VGTYIPEKLLQLWQREEIEVEAVIGHILQNLIELREDFKMQGNILNRVQARLSSTETEQTTSTKTSKKRKD
jgi:hypothetical protein